jgi:hypothetical protein
MFLALHVVDSVEKGIGIVDVEKGVDDVVGVKRIELVSYRVDF